MSLKVCEGIKDMGSSGGQNVVLKYYVFYNVCIFNEIFNININEIANINAGVI